MRLIDADKLIEAFRDFKEWEDDDGNCIHRWGEWQRIDKCINITQEQPTAYDVDKVIGELQGLADMFHNYIGIYDTYYKAVEDGVREAIEIVKGEIK